MTAESPRRCTPPARVSQLCGGPLLNKSLFTGAERVPLFRAGRSGATVSSPAVRSVRPARPPAAHLAVQPLHRPEVGAETFVPKLKFY